VSKASEWAKAVGAAKKIEPEGWFKNGANVNISRDGTGQAHGVVCGHAISATDMLALARWILDTFGEEK